MKVPFYDYSRMYRNEKEQVESKILDILHRSDFILRSDLYEFENSMSDYLGVPYVIGVGNGTDAIWLALMSSDINQDDEVIIPSHTYIATADAIKVLGATPVLVDCQDDHSIDVQAVEDAISGKTKAVIAVNLNGHACDLESLHKVTNRHKIVLIEDNAQGLGAKLNGKYAGTFGASSTLSFFPAKNLGCYGDGGAVVTSNEDIFERVLRLRNHGRDREGNVSSWGLNSRLDNLQAGILNIKLKYLNESILIRRQLAQLYVDGLSDIEEVKLPTSPRDTSKFFDSFQNFEIEVQDRENLRDHLKNNGIETSLPWAGKAIHQFNLPGVKCRDLTKTEKLFKKVLLLPMNQYLTKAEAFEVVLSIRSFYKHKEIDLSQIENK